MRLCYVSTCSLMLIVQTIFFMDVIFDYPEWMYLILYSLPTFTWLVAALAIQIFTTKCMIMAYHLSKSRAIDPLKDKVQGKTVERATYFFVVLIASIYLGAFYVSFVNCDVGAINRLIITIAYTIVMMITVVSSTVFLCILKAKYGSKFLAKRLQIRRLTVVFFIAFLFRIGFNIWFLLIESVDASYTILSFFVYIMCIGVPLITVFT